MGAEHQLHHQDGSEDVRQPAKDRDGALLHLHRQVHLLLLHQRLIRSAERLIGCNLPSLQDVFWQERWKPTAFTLDTNCSSPRPEDLLAERWLCVASRCCFQTLKETEYTKQQYVVGHTKQKTVFCYSYRENNVWGQLNITQDTPG